LPQHLYDFDGIFDSDSLLQKEQMLQALTNGLCHAMDFKWGLSFEMDISFKNQFNFLRFSAGINHYSDLNLKRDVTEILECEGLLY